MTQLPRFLPLRITAERAKASKSRLATLDRLLVIVPGKPSEADLKGLPAREQLSRMAADAHRRRALTASTRLQNDRATVVSIAQVTPGEPFEVLSWARRVLSEALREQPSTMAIVIRGFDAAQRDLLFESIVSSAQAAAFELPRYKSKKSRMRKLRSLVLLEQAQLPDIRLATAGALGNNIARWMTAQPPNMLHALQFRRTVEQIARDYDIDYEFLGETQLQSLGAGAFLAVAQGNADREAGIVHLKYKPATKTDQRLGLVGKGILFDTGGVNLKPFKSMLDMHTDMQGSAVALGTLVALASLGAGFAVDAWLAVTENCISASAYKSQDIVTAINGTTIQVIHTDAEGRMVLADALAIASKESPALLLDFATLTGTCVAALTSRYSGVFSNRSDANAALIEAGRRSGERVWPFPMDADFNDLISSEVADIRQCPVDAAGDHIAAATFLSRFVPPAIPWVHVDLSAGQHKGGLAHVPSDITGFGVRFVLALLNPLSENGLDKALHP